MLTIQKSKRHNGKCTPNVLPCRINHNGPVDATKRYWGPRRASDGITPVSFFRGRKLHGRLLKVPKGYKGVVVTNTDRILPKTTQPPTEDEEEGEEEVEVDVKVLDEQANFDELMVWGHEVVVDEGSDPYVRGVEEWIGFAEQIHSYEEDSLEVKAADK